MRAFAIGEPLSHALTSSHGYHAGANIQRLWWMDSKSSRRVFATDEIEQDQISLQSGVERSGRGNALFGVPVPGESGPGRSTVCS